ncbi:zinc-ribbon domain-containing protein [Cohnella sp.]|uniref:zinc-ribbon domain-containing protein n=1 Tax=Cohnella sp. TaxID=1883426 RepID=UPI0035659DA2
MSFFKRFTDTVSKGVTTATEKAQQTVEITRLNAQISSKRKEIDKLLAKIGESVYEAFKEKDLSLAEAKVIPGCEEISAIYDEIATIDGRIKAIRHEKECVCGKRVPSDTRFCPSCGHPFPEPEPEPVIIEESPIQVEPHVPDDSLSDEESVIQTEEPPSIVDQRQICKSCGTPLFADSHFCPTCGQATR